MRIEKNCLNCKYCESGERIDSDLYSFTCRKKRFHFDYDIKAFIRGLFCQWFEENEVKDNDTNSNDPTNV